MRAGWLARLLPVVFQRQQPGDRGWCTFTEPHYYRLYWWSTSTAQATYRTLTKVRANPSRVLTPSPHLVVHRCAPPNILSGEGDLIQARVWKGSAHYSHLHHQLVCQTADSLSQSLSPLSAPLRTISFVALSHAHTRTHTRADNMLLELVAFATISFVLVVLVLVWLPPRDTKIFVQTNGASIEPSIHSLSHNGLLNQETQPSHMMLHDDGGVRCETPHTICECRTS